MKANTQDVRKAKRLAQTILVSLRGLETEDRHSEAYIQSKHAIELYCNALAHAVCIIKPK